MNAMIDLNASELNLIGRILRRYIPDREVRIFGSRIDGTAKPASDVDLVVMGETTPPRFIMSNLAQAFSESDLPYRVDLLMWAEVKPEFRKIVMEHNEVIQKPI